MLSSELWIDRMRITASPEPTRLTTDRPAVLARALIPVMLALTAALLLTLRGFAPALSLALLMMGLCALSVGLCWPGLRQSAPPAHAVTWAASPYRLLHLILAVVGGVLLLVAAEMSARQTGLWQLHRGAHIHFPLWCAGMAALTWGLAGGLPARRAWRALWRAETGGLLLLTVGALAVRLAGLNSVIPAFVDEVNFIAPIQTFREAPDAQLFHPINNVAAFPRFYVYLQTLSTALLGHDMAGLRTVSAVFGALTVPALYLLARALFPDQRALAWVAAALVATLPIHLQFSRLGMNNIADPLFGTLTFALLAHGLRTGGYAPFALAGIALGLTQYFYEGGRLALPALVMVWLAIAGRGVPPQRLLVMAVGALLVAFPVYYGFYGAGYSFTSRTDDISLLSVYQHGDEHPLALLAGSVGRLGGALAHFLHVPERIHYYGGDAPYIPYHLTPALLLGVGVVIWRLRYPGMGLVGLWAGLPLLALVLLFAEVLSPRIVVVLPALALLSALGLSEAVRALIQDVQRRRRILIGAVALLCALNLGYYFLIHAPTFTRQHFTAQSWQHLVYAAAELPPDTYVTILTDTSYPRFDINVLLNYLYPGQRLGGRLYVWDDVDEALLRELPGHLHHAIYIKMTTAPHRSAEMMTALVEAARPDAVWLHNIEADYMGDHWFSLYFVPMRVEG